MASNDHGLDVAYFNDLFKRELNPSAVARQTPEDLARCLARAARTACSHVLREDEFNWEAVRAVGQVRVGDKIRFRIGKDVISRRVREVLHAGTDKEEVIYNTKRNFYFITAMVLDGKSSQKDVMIRIRPKEPAA